MQIKFKWDKKKSPKGTDAGVINLHTIFSIESGDTNLF